MARPPSPYDFLPQVPTFTVTSKDISDGQPLPQPQVSGVMGPAARTSPPLAWAGSRRGRGLRGNVLRPRRAHGQRILALGRMRHPAGVTELAAGAGAEGGRACPGRGHAPQRRRDQGIRGRGPALGARPPPLLLRRARRGRRKPRSRRFHHSSGARLQPVLPHLGARHDRAHLRGALTGKGLGPLLGAARFRCPGTDRVEGSAVPQRIVEETR